MRCWQSCHSVGSVMLTAPSLSGTDIAMFGLCNQEVFLFVWGIGRSLQGVGFTKGFG